MQAKDRQKHDGPASCWLAVYAVQLGQMRRRVLKCSEPPTIVGRSSATVELRRWWCLQRRSWTQLDVELSSVELSCVGEVSIATPTQLNSTQLTYFALIGALQLGQLHCRSSAIVSCVGESVHSDATQLELSCVAINGHLDLYINVKKSNCLHVDAWCNVKCVLLHCERTKPFYFLHSF